MKQILQDLSLAEIQSLVAELGEQKFRAAQIYRGVMLGKRISDMSDLSKSLRAKLLERFEDEPVKAREVFTSSDGKIPLRTCGRQHHRRGAHVL